MQVLNLDEKNTERMDAINKFTLMDDTFMTQVFSRDLECTEELLKIILKRETRWMILFIPKCWICFIYI